MSNKSTMLLEHHPEGAQAPTFLREYDKLPLSVLPRELTIRTTCCAYRSWS